VYASMVVTIDEKISALCVVSVTETVVVGKVAVPEVVYVLKFVMKEYPNVGIVQAVRVASPEVHCWSSNVVATATDMQV
jgi:hypothetical protein